MYHSIIFDIDGTILDTEIAVISSLQKLLAEELGKNYRAEELNFVLGIPGETALNRLGITNSSGINEKWDRYFKEYFNCVKVFDGIRDTLSVLQEMKILAGIVTSKTKEEFQNDFEPFELTKYFQQIVCADDTVRHKPYPDPILKFIELTGVDKSDALYIGDTEYDWKCAADAGIDFALALWGAKSPSGIHADYKLKHPKQIIELIKGKPVG